MRKIFSYICVMLALLFTAGTADAGYVKGYTRKDGTYVAPYYRSDSRSSSKSPSKVSSRGTTSSGASYTVPKSYQVYQQRQTQGPRVFSKSMKQRKYDEQGGVCPHCHKRCEMDEMEGDHIQPYSKGGTTTYDNLQMLCRPCNRSKGNRGTY